MLLLGFEELPSVWLIAIVVSLVLPMLVMIAHLNLNQTLRPHEKAVWRRELRSHTGLAATWTYLLAGNRTQQTQELERRQQSKVRNASDPQRPS